MSILTILGCEDRPVPVDAGADLYVAPDLAVSPDLRPPPSGIGRPCLDDTACSTGEFCITEADGLPGGYCSVDCSSASCPSDAACFDTGGGGKFCLRSCSGDADCRKDEGYSCNNKLCVPPRMKDGVTPGTRDGGACVTPVVDPSASSGSLFGAAKDVSMGAKFASECQLAVDHANQHIVVAYNDISGSGIGVASSSDDGNMFHAPLELPIDKTVNKNTSQSDPVVAVDSLGTFFVSFVGYDTDNQGNTSNMQVWVARSKDGGVTFPDIFPVMPASEGIAGGLDKPWLAVSPLDDSLMATWFLAGANDTMIRMARSTDHGQTWSAPVTLSDTTRPQVERNLAQSAIDATGKAVVAWVELGGDQFGSTANRIYLQRLASDGSLVGTNVLVSATNDSPAFDDPSVAISGNNVYVGFVSGTPLGDWDVRVSSSLDGGASFAPSVKANADATCATHFNHQVGIDMHGNVHVVWIDNRYLVGNVFHAVSMPAAALTPLSFGTNTFVNTAPFGFTTDRASSHWLGDYLGMALVNGEIYAAWTETPTAAQDSQIYFAKGSLP